MAGAVLAIRMRAGEGNNGIANVAPSRRFPEVIAALGVALLVSTICLLSRGRHFPGSWALLPVIGTCFVIAGGCDTWVARKLLSSRALVFVGLISYPLYLWHWPILAFVRIVEGPHPRWQAIVSAIGAAVLLAALTYRYIEKPIRALRSVMIMRALIGCMVLIGLMGVAGMLGLIKPRSHNTIADQFGVAAQDWDFPGAGFHRDSVDDGLAVNIVGNGARKIMFWGDSNAEQYGPRIEKLIAANPNATVYFATAGNCPPIRHTRISAKPGCESYADKAFAFARDGPASTIIIAAQWSGYLTSSALVFSKADETFLAIAARDRAMSAFANTIEALRAANKRVVVVLNIPVSDDLDPRNMLKRHWNGNFSTNTEGILIEQWKAERSYLTGNFAEVAQRAGAMVIDPTDSLCPQQRCLSVDEQGEPIYRDGRHLRARFVREKILYLDQLISP